MAVCSKYSTEVVLDASTLYFGKEQLSCIEPDTSLTGGESFIIYNLNGGFQFWFSVDSTGSAPTPPNGETLVEVALPASYTLAQLSTALETAASGEFYFYDPKEDHSQLLLESLDVGEVAQEVTDVDTGWDVHTITTGFELNLGDTAEGIVVTFETGKVDVTADQTGPLVLTQLVQATSASLTAGLQEISKDRLRRLIADGFGDSYTPSGGTELIGYGTSKIGTNALELSGRLRLHPIRMGDDRTEDVNFWKTVPDLTEANYSGTEKKVLATSWTAYRDEFKPEEINIVAIGDGSQDLTA